MTALQAQAATAFIVNPAIREMAAARLRDGRTFICPDCGQIASTDAGCAPCDDVMFASQEAEYDARMSGAETATGCDAYARY